MFKTGLRSKLVRSAGIYTISNILNSAIPFLIMPILTRYLSPADYGVTATFQVLVGFVAPFTGLSIHGAIARKYYDKDEVDLPKYITNCLFILLASSLITGLIFWVGAAHISRWSVFPREWLWAVIAVSIGQFISLVVLTLWQVQTKSLQYGAFQVILTLLNVGISLWLIAGIGMNWEGRLWAQIVTGVFSVAIGVYILWKSGWIKSGLDFSYISSALKFGVPLIPYAFAGWVTTAIDRIFINKMVSIADTGIYSVGYQIAMIISIIEMSFNSAWVPWFYEKLKQDTPEIKYKIVKFTYAYYIAIMLLALCLSFSAPWFLKYFIGKEFRGASSFLMWLGIAKAVEAISFMAGNYIFYSNKTIYLAFTSIIFAVVHILANYMLISRNGAIGAAQSTLITSVVVAAVTWVVAARVHKMPWLLGWSK